MGDTGKITKILTDRQSIAAKAIFRRLNDKDFKLDKRIILLGVGKPL
jgi:hypothetical protein